MGIISSFLTNSDNISRGFKKVFKGTSFYMLKEDGKLKAFIAGEVSAKKIIDIYNKDKNYKVSLETIKKAKSFIKKNEELMICVLDKELLTLKEIKEKYDFNKIKPDKLNKFMIGFRKYNQVK